MHWLNNNNIFTRVTNIVINHESNITFNCNILDINPMIENGIPRPLRKNKIMDCYDNDFKIFTDFKKDKFIVIGSFGFGTPGKGFDKIIQYANTEFEMAIIKLIITHPHSISGDTYDSYIQNITNVANTKKMLS